MQTCPQEASFGHRGQPMVQVTPLKVSPNKASLALGSRTHSLSVAPTEGHKRRHKMFCKNRITLIGFLGKDAETRFIGNGTSHKPVLVISSFDRHRGGGRPPTPATPPYVRVRIRRFEKLR
jgi:hypothetical protein